MRKLTYWAILAAIWLPFPAMAAPRFIPDCAGPVEIAHAHVVRVEKNGALVLDDGRAVMLEGIRLDGGPDGPSDRALSALREMALAGPVTFTAVAPKEDRYDRIRAQAFGETWFQTALLEQGLARVAIAPDRNGCAPDLYEAEQRGRARQAGLWASPASAPRAPEAMKSAVTGSFQIVDGWVTNVGRADGKTFIDFGSDGRRMFSAVVEPDDRRAFRDFDLAGLEAHHIRIRGIVQEYRGRPQIELSNPSQIEVLN
ncbi:MAG TPA: thermonuclease family protein [Rhizomicrobium sp.]|nr:thermonuclease family protein [Rhizomicrobium sp.]